MLGPSYDASLVTGTDVLFFSSMRPVVGRCLNTVAGS